VNGFPHGWAEVTLQDVAIWSSGGTPSRANPAYYKGEIPWFKTGELGPHVLYSAEEHISQAAVDASSAKLFAKGSVALAMYGATIGKTSIFGIDAATNQACAVGAPDAVSAEFLYHFLVSQEKFFCEAGKGGAQPNISQGIVKSWPFLLPPSAEQTRILEKLEELLTGLDAGVAELKAAQKKLVQYRQSLLKAAVEGALTAEWRANNPPTETGAQLLERILQERRARWEAKQLAKFKEQGKAPPKDWQKKYPEPVKPETPDLPELPQGWIWASAEMLYSWGSGDFLPASAQVDGAYSVYGGNGINGQHNAANVSYGTIVIGRVGVHCGNVYRTKSAAWITDNAIYATSKHDCVTWQYSELVMQAARLGASSKGGAQPFISQKILNDTLVAVPPVNEQEQIFQAYISALQASEAMSVSFEISLKQSTAQRQNILKAAFSGQLVAQDPSDEPASELLERIRTERAAQQAVKKPRGRKVKEAA